MIAPHAMSSPAGPAERFAAPVTLCTLQFFGWTSYKSGVKQQKTTPQSCRQEKGAPYGHPHATAEKLRSPQCTPIA